MDPGLLTDLPLFVTAKWVSVLEPSISLCFCNHICTATNTVAQGVSSGRATTSIRKWQKWVDFCTELGLDPFLGAFKENFPILKVFVHQVRIGELAAGGNKIGSRLVGDYLRAVAQILLSMGNYDPRLNSDLKTDFCIGRMLAAENK